MDGKVLGLLTALCFGLNPVLLKMGFLRKGRSDVAVVIGLIVTIPVYLLVSPFLGGFEWSRITIAALVGFVLGGLFGGGIGRTWMYKAIDLIGASPATAIKNAAPVITTGLAIFLFGEHVTLVQWLAIVAIVGGVSLVTWKPGQGTKQLMTTGVLVALGSAVVYGIRPVFLEFGLDNANVPLTGAMIGAIAALLFAAARTGPSNLLVGLREPSVGLFTASGVLQAFGFLALTFGLANADLSIVYPVVSSAPLITLGFTALLLRGKEPLSWRISLGIVLVVAGVIAL